MKNTFFDFVTKGGYMDISTIKECFPHCKIIENDGIFTVYTKADNLFELYVKNDKTIHYSIVGHQVILPKRDGYYVVKVLPRRQNLFDPEIVACFIDDYYPNENRYVCPGFVYIKKNDKDDLRNIINTLYDAYVSMLCINNDEKCELINLVIDDASMESFIEKTLWYSNELI